MFSSYGIVMDCFPPLPANSTSAFERFILSALLHCCCLARIHFISEMSHMTCHLLPQPWRTLKCMIYLDLSCDLCELKCLLSPFRPVLIIVYRGFLCPSLKLCNSHCWEKFIHCSLSHRSGMLYIIMLCPFDVSSVSRTDSICVSTNKRTFMSCISAI